MRKTLFFFFLLIPLFASEINIAVAANVSYAIKDLVKTFNKIYPDIKVRVILGSSGKLTAQIQNNAPYDLFLSANMKYPDFLYKKGFAYTRPVVYAYGALAFVSFHKKISSINDLKKLKTIALPNPKLAPYGKAAEEFLKNSGLKSKNIIYTQTITQALSYAISATDGAFISKSALSSKNMKQYHFYSIEIPEKYYHLIKQGMVLLLRAKNNKDAAAFFAFMLSKNAQKILKQYGYSIK